MRIGGDEPEASKAGNLWAAVVSEAHPRLHKKGLRAVAWRSTHFFEANAALVTVATAKAANMWASEAQSPTWLRRRMYTTYVYMLHTTYV